MASRSKAWKKTNQSHESSCRSSEEEDLDYAPGWFQRWRSPEQNHPDDAPGCSFEASSSSSKNNAQATEVAEAENPSQASGSQRRRRQGRQCTRKRSSGNGGDHCLISHNVAAAASTRRRKSAQNSKKGKQNKATAKATIFSWLIDSNIIQEKATVGCADKGELRWEMIKDGIITREGIKCCCCGNILGVVEFLAHAGFKQPSIEPYKNIFVVHTNISLLSCMIEAWNRPEELSCHRFNDVDTKNYATDLHDDACMVCADGGDLMCCDECNSTYHQACIGMEAVPDNVSWHCPYCVCKFCGEPAYKNDYLLTCSQCEKKYHWECYTIREQVTIDVNSTPCTPLCEQSCRQVHKKLKNTVGVNNVVEKEYSWRLLHRMDEEFGVFVHDLHQRVETHSKLAVEWRLMEKCFEPIKDRHTRIYDSKDQYDSKCCL